jgi:hypothetical protein
MVMMGLLVLALRADWKYSYSFPAADRTGSKILAKAHLRKR